MAAAAARLAANPEMAGWDTRAQLQFLGEENLKNRSAVENLLALRNEPAPTKRAAEPPPAF